MCEINFLCVHKKLRSKRLAPVLIKEVTRRVNLRDIWQAVYTAGVVIPKPVGSCRYGLGWSYFVESLFAALMACFASSDLVKGETQISQVSASWVLIRYWHRSLNVRKLIEVEFSRLQPRMTLNRTIRLYKLPTVSNAPVIPSPFVALAHVGLLMGVGGDVASSFLFQETRTPGFRPMTEADIPAVTKLMHAYLTKCVLLSWFSGCLVPFWWWCVCVFVPFCFPPFFFLFLGVVAMEHWPHDAFSHGIAGRSLPH